MPILRCHLQDTYEIHVPSRQGKRCNLLHSQACNNKAEKQEGTPPNAQQTAGERNQPPCQ